MSKYELLWDYIKNNAKSEMMLSFDEINQITGVPIDHSFLNAKKELKEFGWKVGKISLKEQTVRFERKESEN